jgi:membrane protein DedA with SNARE-associated domain
MHSALLWLTQLLMQYGYPALFLLLMLGIIGLPAPDETLLTFCGYLIYSGRLQFALTFATGFCGSAAGITISYFLGARFARYVPLSAGRLLKTEQLFERYGPPLLTFGYFVPGVRHFTAVAAGMSRLPFPKFALFAYFGAALWVVTFLTLGYFVGDGWLHSSEVIHRYVLGGTASAAVILAAIWLVRVLRKRIIHSPN